MRLRRPNEQRIFFPWEANRGLRRRLGLNRARPLLIVGALVALVVLIGMRERRRAGVRQTRATLTVVRASVDAYVADHDGGCPETLTELTRYGSFEAVPKDAWGRPLRLTCPGQVPGERYELMSDGPDGKPGGLDRIE